MPSTPQLSDGEWEVMKALWDRAPISVSDLCAHLTPATEWHPKTIRTMLIRLEKKRVVGTKSKDGIYQYYPLVSREACSRSATHSFMDRVFDGALAPMVAHFASRRALTAEEKRELKKLLDNKG
ncbi:MAG TPA: BlaI/MecI/CopY family transcriptional regulator [Steroidobacteraceae bacterium]|nr:BlaI/MecI/CopY family transcriptional regulator [Steroidobacteraceae bacterium]